MSSTKKKRPKPKYNSSSSSSSSWSWTREPPQSLIPSKEDLLRLITVVTIASSVALTCNYLANFLNPTFKPFCDSNISILDSPDYRIDSCEPCPSNGQCHQGKLECLHGYRQQGKLCVEDRDINETAGRLSKWVESRLCRDYADFLCDGTGSIWVEENDIWNNLDGHELMEIFEPDNAIYLYTKKRTMETVLRYLELRTNSYGMKEVKCPDLLAERYKPVSCRIQQWVSKHALEIGPVCALLVGCILLLYKDRRRRYFSIRVEELYHQVCEILEENALTSKTVNGEGEPWVVASRLRDHLLLPKERKDRMIWKKVEELVQQDSRVDQYPKLLKGESKVVWEWQVEGSLSSSKMRKKGEASKFRADEGSDLKLGQQQNSLKAEPKALFF